MIASSARAELAGTCRLSHCAVQGTQAVHGCNPIVHASAQLVQCGLLIYQETPYLCGLRHQRAALSQGLARLLRPEQGRHAMGGMLLAVAPRHQSPACVAQSGLDVLEAWTDRPADLKLSCVQSAAYHTQHCMQARQQGWSQLGLMLH